LCDLTSVVSATAIKIAIDVLEVKRKNITRDSRQHRKG